MNFLVVVSSLTSKGWKIQTIVVAACRGSKPAGEGRVNPPRSECEGPRAENYQQNISKKRAEEPHLAQVTPTPSGAEQTG
jgi:hypothetical protein